MYCYKVGINVKLFKIVTVVTRADGGQEYRKC
jgi:hypothetical protein